MEDYVLWFLYKSAVQNSEEIVRVTRLYLPKRDLCNNFPIEMFAISLLIL